VDLVGLLKSLAQAGITAAVTPKAVDEMDNVDTVDSMDADGSSVVSV